MTCLGNQLHLNLLKLKNKIMEKKKITAGMIISLREPLPKESISQHPTKTFLSTIKAIYVVERLNNVFGHGLWNVKNEVIKDDTKHIVVKSVMTFTEYFGEIEAFGGNDNADLGDAYKGACTDALTKIGSYLEIGIEVFKGLHDKGKQTEEKAWMTEKQYQKLSERIFAGEKNILEKAMKSFKMKDEYKQGLEKLILEITQ